MVWFDEDLEEGKLRSAVYLMIAFSILFLISLLLGFFVIISGNQILGIILMVGSLLALCFIGIIFAVYRDVIKKQIKKKPKKKDDDIDELLRLYRD
ncbi:MAG: hypothetical protein QGH39_01970 [Candidatus Thermoplasmatota archaeon]|jgi:uncharacterized protein YneF (UPF0154 family)|nr:hypothetical protein [Candidatus Thermoplasmatota archaeon]MDP7264307.1 hypothetical protein [Candidatus Thermoplasmatota archaeon]